MTLHPLAPGPARGPAPGPVRVEAGRSSDGVTLLTGYLVLLTALSSKLVLAPLGAVGAPATILAACAALWWLISRGVREDHPGVPWGRPPVRPVRVVLLGFVAVVLLSRVLASARPPSAAEVNSADTGLVMLAGWVGLVLIAGDRIPDLSRLQTLVTRLVVAVGAVAGLGVLQFVTGQTLVDITLPGFSINNGAAGLADRDGFSRVIGTTIHPIEFGVLTGSMLPMCVHRARFSTGGLVRRSWPLVVVSLAVPMSVSRSAVIAAGVALACSAPTWTRAGRRMAFAYAGMLTVVVFVAVPGMLGTLVKLFVGLTDDSSAQSRSDGIAVAGMFVARSPWFGRGFKTFLPQYQTLDNQYVGLLIEVGVVGVLAFVAVLVVGVALAVVTRRRSSDPMVRSLAGALAGSIAGVAVSLAFFDALSFPMVTGQLFLLLGCVEALSLLGREPR